MPPDVEPDVPLVELELPPYGGKATSGLRMLSAEPCLSTSFQFRDELPLSLEDIVGEVVGL